eukprot:2624579-Alexandrium_andersonii.AAC.1
MLRLELPQQPPHELDAPRSCAAKMKLPTPLHNSQKSQALACAEARATNPLCLSACLLLTERRAASTPSRSLSA